MSELPKSWLKIYFTELLDIVGGTQPPKKTFLYEPREGYIRLLQIRDFGSKPLATFIPDKPNLKKCNNDDILIGRYGASVGRICSGMEGAYNVALAKVVIPDLVHRRYIYYFLKSSDFQKAITSFARSAQDGFNKEDLASINLPLAPLNEQKRIVAKLEELLPRVEACKERLEKIPTILKRFRQSVLAAAVSGRLTEEWRLKNFDAAYDSEGQPTGWKLVSLRQVVAKINYGSSTKSDKAGEIPVLRMGNIQEGEIDWSNLVYTSNEHEIKKYILEPNTVLFNRTNSPELVGKTAIFRGERKAIFAGYLIRIIVGDRLDAEYLNMYLNAPVSRQWCSEVRSDGVSQSNINAQKLGDYEVRLPSLEEQREIVRKVNVSLTKIKLVLDAVDKSLKYTSRALDSILATASSGTLVSQNLTDEPASVLLERIKSMSTQPQKTERSKKNKTTKLETAQASA